MRLFRPFLGGRKPSKQKRSVGNPELTRAGTKAVAPGNVSTSIPAATQARTSKNPGSEIPGVPASVTRASVCPPFILSTMRSTTRCSLCA